MSDAPLLHAKENPWPGLALASLNLLIALFLAGVSLLLGITASLLAWLHSFVDRQPLRPLHDLDPEAGSQLHHLLDQRLALARRVRVRHDRSEA